MQDLSYIYDIKENEIKLEKEITNINKSFVKESVDVYNRDPKPYYDPTLNFKEEKKSNLISALEKVKKDLYKNQPIFSEENFSVKQKIQNLKNLNNENNNKFIRENYWTENKIFDRKKKINFFKIIYLKIIRK
jgi:hypothetical protein